MNKEKLEELGYKAFYFMIKFVFVVAVLTFSSILIINSMNENIEIQIIEENNCTRDFIKFVIVEPDSFYCNSFWWNNSIKHYGYSSIGCVDFEILQHETKEELEEINCLVNTLEWNSQKQEYFESEEFKIAPKCYKLKEDTEN